MSYGEKLFSDTPEEDGKVRMVQVAVPFGLMKAGDRFPAKPSTIAAFGEWLIILDEEQAAVAPDAINADESKPESKPAVPAKSTDTKTEVKKG